MAIEHNSSLDACAPNINKLHVGTTVKLLHTNIQLLKVHYKDNNWNLLGKARMLLANVLT